MRHVLVPLAGLFLFTAVGRADDAADAKAVVEKAIEARGDKPDGKFTAMTWKEKGVLTTTGGKMTYTADWSFQAPDKYRFLMAGEIGDVKINMTVVVNGEKAWTAFGGQTEEAAGEKLEQTRNEVYQLWVNTLTPLLADKNFTLATAKGKDVSGRPAVAVTVTRARRPAMTLYFDRDGGLLVKTEMLMKDEFQKWKEVLEEAYFTDHKEADGRRHFTKLRVVRDGKPIVESTLSDQKAVEKLDAKLFEKP